MRRSLWTNPRTWLLVLAVAVLALVITAVLLPDAVVPVALGLTAATSLAALALVHVRTAGLARAVRTVRAEVTAHHKKASTWDWRLTHRLERAGVLPPEVAPEPAGHPWKDHPHTAELVETGAF